MMAPTYAEMVKEILAAQDPANPAFVNEREVREYLATTYPALEGNYDAVRRMHEAKFKIGD